MLHPRNARLSCHTTSGDCLTFSWNCSTTVSLSISACYKGKSSSRAIKTLRQSRNTKVHKFWSGLWKDLQCDLWKEKLNPEISSLKKVVATAEILEIAQSITGDSSRKSQRPNNKKRDTGNDNAPPEEDSSSKHWQKRHRRRKDRHHGWHKEAKLSKDEQERHKAEGLCYICHKSGHFSRNCPERQKVSSSSKPPGVTSFGVDVDRSLFELHSSSQSCYGRRRPV